MNISIGSCDGSDLAGDQPVDAAEHGILLVDDRRDALGEGAEQGRQRRIAAEADDGRGLEAVIELARHAAAFENLPAARDPAADAARQTPGGEHMRLHILEQAGKLRAALVGHQGDAMPARHQLLRDGMGRDHVPARAARRQHIVPEYAHRPLRLTTLEERAI